MVQAWKRSQHIRAIGVEYDAAIYQKALKVLQENNLQDSIQVLHDNVLNIDISDATVLFVYLVPDGMKKMREALINAIERGARVVTYGKLLLFCQSSAELIAPPMSIALQCSVFLT